MNPAQNKPHKLLLIIDPQIDFIYGSLPVPGAADAMTRLASFIREQGDSYSCKIVTTDWHPVNHFSFESNGGPWPSHCVQDTQGAAILPDLLKALNCTPGKVFILTKGLDPETEEYSVFRNSASNDAFRKIVAEYNINEVDICGLAGDVCVLNSLKEGLSLYPGIIFKVLDEFSPSLDGGKSLREFINSHALQ